MRTKLSLIAVLSILIFTSALPAWAITWGEPDTDYLYPNVGAMVVDWPGYGPWQYCSGTLIHPQVFLTAAHCTYDLDVYGIETVWVNFDLDALEEDGLRLVEAVYTHPGFNFSSPDHHDIALLVLEEPVEGIAPAPLPPAGYLDALKKSGALRVGPRGTKFTMVGYGGSLDWPPPSIYYEDIRQFSFSSYVSLTSSQLHLSQLVKKGDGGTCFGDSGGPSFYVDGQGNHIVVGITSWGDAMCVATSFNYRVDTVDSLAFIQSVIDSLD
jgi:secreted trypsin-like serine protease